MQFAVQIAGCADLRHSWAVSKFTALVVTGIVATDYTFGETARNSRIPLLCSCRSLSIQLELSGQQIGAEAVRSKHVHKCAKFFSSAEQSIVNRW